ncbi:MAG TPA: hypothetical protein VMN36_18425 [Verrucomicrobiales bacterium]|nr:hypothetical protein [Verrucomicrobiales bacterium]
MLALIFQLVLAGLVVCVYEIEGPAFLRLFVLAAAGFIVNLLLPAAWRLPFFVILSLAGVFLVFEPADGAWLIGCGLLLIALCHLPVPPAARVIILLLVGGLLAASRAGAIPSPWAPVLWPILGSMFMFRLLLYARALKDEPAPGRWWAALGYFFMFPNLVFPLFPVIDYQTFRRTHYDKDETGIYEQGLMWIARGLVHLVLYRLIYHQALNDPAEVADLGDLVQFMLGTFLLYLKVSGMFHLIVGLLHLFGFRLPETHKLYYLAQGFTELWRRINIYWKDFMMSLVFYPVYFRAKQRGAALSVGIATAAVFATTWALHSYQWFWLRGGFPITLQDILFWGLLGSLVVIGALRELKRGPKPRQKAGGWSLRAGLKTFATFAVFCFLWSLWSTESIGQWLWMLGAAARVDLKGIVLLGLMFVTLVLLGGRNWDAQATQGPRWWQAVQRPVVRTSISLIVLLVLAAPALQALAPARVAESLAALRKTGFNVRDAAMRHRGYYEQLDVRPQLMGQDLQAPGLRPDDWQELSSTGVFRIRDDFLERDLLPSRSVTWNGLQFSTNQWGMRDQEYTLQKPAGALRIALMGPSHVMGNGVGDGEVFESLVEERLNREFRLTGFEGFEILNFGVDGYCMTQQVTMLEDRVFNFSPDVVIATGYQADTVMTNVFLQKIVSRGIEVPYAPLAELLAGAGLEEARHGKIPIPFEGWRRAARWFGLEPRPPHAESQARIRQVADDVSAWSVARFAEVTRSHGARPVILAMDSVLDEPARELPNAGAIREAGLPVIDLLDAYPQSQRAALRVATWDEHPNAAGHQVIADRLYPELTRFLERELAKP